MSRSVTEVLLASQEPEKRPIHNYIDYFQAYQVHTGKSKRHLYYYFLVSLGLTVGFHVYMLAAYETSIVAIEILYYLPYLIWFKILLLYRRSFSVQDPHILNEKRYLEFLVCKVALFSFFIILFIVLFIIFAFLHAFVGFSGRILIVVDCTTLFLSERVMLQTKALEQRLKSTVASFRNNRTFFLSDYSYGQMKEPLQMQDEFSEQKQFNPTSRQLFTTTFKNHKESNRLSHEIEPFDEHLIYSH